MKYLKLFEDYHNAERDRFHWTPIDWQVPPGERFLFSLGDTWTWESWLGVFDAKHLAELRDHLDTESLCNKLILAITMLRMHGPQKTMHDQTLEFPPRIDKLDPGMRFLNFFEQHGEDSISALTVGPDGDPDVAHVLPFGFVIPSSAPIKNMDSSLRDSIAIQENVLFHGEYPGAGVFDLPTPVGDLEHASCFWNTNNFREKLEEGVYDMEDLEPYISEIIELGAPKKFLRMLEKYKNHTSPEGKARKQAQVEKDKNLGNTKDLMGEAYREWTKESSGLIAKISKATSSLYAHLPQKLSAGTPAQRKEQAQQALADYAQQTSVYLPQIASLVDKYNRLYPGAFFLDGSRYEKDVEVDIWRFKQAWEGAGMPLA